MFSAHLGCSSFLVSFSKTNLGFVILCTPQLVFRQVIATLSLCLFDHLPVLVCQAFSFSLLYLPRPTLHAYTTDECNSLIYRAHVHVEFVSCFRNYEAHEVKEPHI